MCTARKTDSDRKRQHLMTGLPRAAPARARPTGRLLPVLGFGFGLAVTIGNSIGAGILRVPGEIAVNALSPGLPNLGHALRVWAAAPWSCTGRLRAATRHCDRKMMGRRDGTLQSRKIRASDSSRPGSCGDVKSRRARTRARSRGRTCRRRAGRRARVRLPDRQSSIRARRRARTSGV